MIQRTKPAWWVPTLYFVEGVPYFMVNSISVLMLTRLGMSNAEMAFFTSLLSTPWVIKPLWSPFVDVVRTKRWWIVAMQALMGITLLMLAFSVPTPTGEQMAESSSPVSIFRLTLALFTITAYASATHDIAADGFYMLATTHEQQSFYVGIRSTFYRLSSIFGQGVLVYLAGRWERSTGSIPTAWSYTLLAAGVIMAVATLYHAWVLPKPSSDYSHLESSQHEHQDVETDGTPLSRWKKIGREEIRTVSTFLAKPGVWTLVAFVLLYRLPEALLIKMINPFMVSPVESGGLAMTVEEVGIIYGTIGVAALTLGGVMGGWAVNLWGLRPLLWLMASAITLPCGVFVWMSVVPHDHLSLPTIATCVAVEQWGYGFGFTAFLMYMMHFAEGEFATTHYAFCTGLMALGMQLPGMGAGWLQEKLGYPLFFTVVMLACTATFVVTALAKPHIEVGYGKREKGTPPSASMRGKKDETAG